jgi:hypothetical protein
VLVGLGMSTTSRVVIREHFDVDGTDAVADA